MNPRVIQMTVAAASMTLVGVSMDDATRHVIVRGAEQIVGIGHGADDDATQLRAHPGRAGDRGRWIGRSGGGAPGGVGDGRQHALGAGGGGGDDVIGGGAGDRDGRHGIADRDGAAGFDAGSDGDAGGGIDGGALDGVGGHGHLSGTGEGIAGGGGLAGLVGTDPGDGNRDRGHGDGTGTAGTGTAGTGTAGSGGTVDVPEPGMFGLLGVGLAGVAWARRRARARLARTAGERGAA